MRAAASLLLALCVVACDGRADGEAYLGMPGDATHAPPRDMHGAVVPTSGAVRDDPLRALAEVLRGLAAQAEALRRGLEDLPRSEEAERLAEQWRRLLDEIASAQDDAEESLREDILPRLRDELEALKKRLEELQPKERRPTTSIGTWI
ncbi:MAG: hypothetical protein ACREXX_07795 [Gammaproteobacteria bacterium]